jgi:hypothetical protein
MKIMEYEKAIIDKSGQVYYEYFNEKKGSSKRFYVDVPELDNIKICRTVNRALNRGYNPYKHGRSCNPGSVSDIHSFIFNIAYERIYYNVGYLKSDSWYFFNENRAETDFMHTAAHEIGHEILKSFGGTTYSYNHKETSTWYQTKVKNKPYPSAPNEIDLMKYSDDEYIPSDYYTRSIVAKEDALGMLWLIKIIMK